MVSKEFLERFVVAAMDDEPVKSIDRLLRDRPVHLDAFRTACSEGKVGQIQLPGHLSIPQFTAWNEAAGGGDVSPAAEELVRFIIGTCFQREAKLMLQLADISHDWVSDPLLKRHLERTLGFPVLTEADLERAHPMATPFVASRGSSATTSFALTVSGWEKPCLQQNRSGFGWISSERFEKRRARFTPELISLEDYLGRAGKRVIEDSRLGRQERQWVKEAARELIELHTCLIRSLAVPPSDPARLHHEEFDMDEGQSLRVFVVKNPSSPVPNMLLLDRSDLSLVCGAFGGLPYVFPEHRGKGYGPLMHKVNEQNELGIFFPAYYSRSGYQTRCAAHRNAVVAAYNEGREVLPGNLVRYAREIGREDLIPQEPDFSDTSMEIEF